MEKLSEISLGRKGLMVKFGSLFVILFIGLILFLGFYEIKIPKYTDVEIVAINENIFLISDADLNRTENITLESGVKVKVYLEKIDRNKYKLQENNFTEILLESLKKNILTDGKILLEKQNLFENLLPFF